MTDDTETQLIPRASIEQLVATYQQAEAKIRQGFALVDSALADLDGIFSGPHEHVRIKGRYGRSTDCDWGDPTDHLKELRRELWQDLIERMQIRKIMSVEAWTKFSDKMKREDPPDITVDNVRGMIANFRSEAPAMLEAAVKEVFEWLRPHYDRFKTNSQFEVGERVVLEYCVERSWSCWAVHHHRQQNLIALENVFLMLDGGRRRDETGRYYSDIETAIKACKSDGPCEGETEYFEFRGWKKGTLHLRFKRADLVGKLNAVAGGARLKPPSRP